jgi:hypothetical protein
MTLLSWPEEKTSKKQLINCSKPVTHNSWTKQWRNILNEIKSVHVNFTNQKVGYIQVTINGNPIPYGNMAKYLGKTLDTKLQQKEHVKKKIEELNIKYRKVKWLLGRMSQLSIQNKILV